MSDFNLITPSTFNMTCGCGGALHWVNHAGVKGYRCSKCQRVLSDFERQTARTAQGGRVG